MNRRLFSFYSLLVVLFGSLRLTRFGSEKIENDGPKHPVLYWVIAGSRKPFVLGICDDSELSKIDIHVHKRFYRLREAEKQLLESRSYLQA